MNMVSTTDVDGYIATFPTDVQELLNKVRATIKKAAPKAEEVIKYGIPTYVLNGNLIHFGGFKNHIGVYPTPSGIEEFKKELSAYTGSKGAIQFPLNKPFPYSLLTKIVKYRISQSAKKAGLGKPTEFLDAIGAPAKRALEIKGINTLTKLSKYSEKELLQLHGVGRSAIPKLKSALASKGLVFRKS